MSRSSINFKAASPAGREAVFHIEQAWLLLNAANEIHELNGNMYRSTLSLAMQSLGDAVTALQAHASAGVDHA